MKEVNWKNTLHDSVRGHGHLEDFAKTCIKLGYPYMCWNDRIYSVEQTKENSTTIVSDTGLVIDDVGKGKSNAFTKGYVILAFNDFAGDSQMAAYEVEYTGAEFNEGIHYKKAKELAEEDGHSAPFVCFDSTEHFEIVDMAKLIEDF